jgi:hypothetical protein
MSCRSGKDRDCRIWIGRIVPDGSVETIADRQSTINGQLLEQSGVGAFSGQQGMPSGIAISESIDAETSTPAEVIAADCAAAGRASGVATRPSTATTDSTLAKAVKIFTGDGYHRLRWRGRWSDAISRQRELTLQVR